MRKQLYIILIILLPGAIGCKKALFEVEPQNNPEALFEDLWTTFNTDYAPFEERGVDWQEQYQVYRPQVNPGTSEPELLEVFKMMLRTLDDGHVSITVPDADVYYANLIIDLRIDDELFNLNVIKTNYLQDNYSVNGYDLNTYGWIGQVGYWHIDAIGENMLELDGILDYFASAEGLIIDLRHNKGGNFTYAFSEFGRLTDEKRFVFRSKTKNGKGPIDYTEWYDWNIYPSGAYFDKPIVLLTDRYTISAGERAVMALKTLPNLVHIGDTTNGAFATKIGKELANGWYYSVVTQKIEYQDGLYYEGKGMPPDIYVKNTLSEMAAGQDKTLELALDQF